MAELLSTTEELSPILTDPLFELCIRFALGVHNPQGYGALLVNENKIIGVGRNIAVRRDEPWPFRQGTSNHAEGMAIATAVAWREEVTGAEIFVAGILPAIVNSRRRSQEDLLFIHHPEHPDFTCRLCVGTAGKWGVSAINIPLPTTWHNIPLQQARDSVASHREKVSPATDNLTGRLMSVSGDRLQDLDITDCSPLAIEDLVERIHAKGLGISSHVHHFIALMGEGRILTKTDLFPTFLSYTQEP